MRRGIVLARAGRSATVLLDGGEFVRVPAQGWDVGDEVSLPERLPERMRRRSMRAYGYAAGALAAVLALLPVLIPAASAQVVAYVSVDINPSVELGLGSSGRIVTASAIDGDGQKLLKTVHLQGKTLPQAVLALLHTASHQGYLRQSRDVSVILAEYPAGAGALSKGIEKGLQGARNAAAQFAQAHHYVGVVSALIAPSWVRSAASQQHVSVGLYAVWSALHSANVKVSLHALKGRALGQAIAGVEKNAKGSEVLKVLSGTKVLAHSQPVKSSNPGHNVGPSVTGTHAPHTGTTTGSNVPSKPPTGAQHGVHHVGETGSGTGGGSPTTGGGSSPGHNTPPGTNGEGSGSTPPPTASRGTATTTYPAKSGPAHVTSQPPIIVVTPNSQFQYSYPSSEDSGQKTNGNGRGGSSDGGGSSQGTHGTKGQSGDGNQSGTTQKSKKSSQSDTGGQGGGSQRGQSKSHNSGQNSGKSGDGQTGAGAVWQGFGQTNFPSGGSGSGGSGSSGSSDGGSGSSGSSDGSGSGGLQNPFNGGQNGGDSGGGGN